MKRKKETRVESKGGRNRGERVDRRVEKREKKQKGRGVGRGEQRGERKERGRNEKEREVKKKEKTRVERRAHGAVWQHCETRGCTCSFITEFAYCCSQLHLTCHQSSRGICFPNHRPHPRQSLPPPAADDHQMP